MLKTVRIAIVLLVITIILCIGISKIFEIEPPDNHSIGVFLYEKPTSSY